MLSKEQVLDIIAYCDEHKINRKVRLKELGIGEWQFYTSRRRYLREELESGVPAGRFIQLRSTEKLVPESVSAMELSVNPGRKPRESASEMLHIECQTPRGGMLRMSGSITPVLLSTLLQSL